MPGQPPEPPKPGIYYDVPADEYFSWRAVNNSSLSYALRSMEHYRWSPPIAQTNAMRLGTLVHAGRLEPASIGARYTVMPDFAKTIRKEDGSEYSNVRATKAYKEAVAEWRQTIGDREECTADEMDQMLGMVAALTLHDFAREHLCRKSYAEVCFVWEDKDSGVLCKCRADKWDGTGTLTDLKTTIDASDFERSIGKYRYHRQAAFYADGAAACPGQPHRFAIVAVEKQQPYGVRGAYMSDDAMDAGRREYKRLLLELAECRSTGEWPGYSDPVAWDAPAWACEPGEEIGISINGEIVA